MADEVERLKLALAAKDKEIDELKERVQKIEAESHKGESITYPGTDIRGC